jgi:ATP-dependent exoDNAse (exonuclease V) beta subunit
VFRDELLQNSPGLMHFREFYSKLNSQPGARISDMIRFAVDDCGYGRLVLSSAGGVQAYANVQKFLDIVLDGEREISDRKGVINLLLSMGEAGSTEEAPLHDDRSDAVRLMTVHASKGLEFPVVFIADSIRSGNNRFGDMLIHKEYGLIFRIRDDGLNPLFELSGKIMRELQAAETERVDREEKRILYVAMTRARDGLYISFPERAARKGKWSSLVGEFLKSLNFTVPEVNDAVSKMGDITLRFVRSGGKEEDLPEVRRNEPLTAPVLNDSSLNLDIEGLREQEWFRLTPSGVASFLICPYRVALSAGKTVKGTDGRDGLKATERGSMIHLFLEHYNYVTGRMPEFLKKVSGDLYEDALAVSRRFIDSELGALARAAAAEGRLRREVQFSSRYGRFILNGKIDMLIETGGRKMVIDYKSGNLEGGETENRYQLMIYASALAKIYGTDNMELFNFYLDRDQPVENCTVTGEEIRKFEALLLAAMNSYALHDFKPRPAAENCLHCRFAGSCAYRYGGAV